MMFIAKFKYFFHKLSFVQIKQGHRIDLWYQINKNEERLSKITQLDRSTNKLTYFNACYIEIIVIFV